MFKIIEHIDDVRPFVAHKPEIRFLPQSNGCLIGCYHFSDSKTFDTPESYECRGIIFDAQGRLVSRPLHKFFNVGEKEHLMPERILASNQLAATLEKLDGSMLATALIDGVTTWRSRKSFNADVVRLTLEYLQDPQARPAALFADICAHNGFTAIFELTHPQARIVVAQSRPQLRLLHVRCNRTGEYVLLDKSHALHEDIARLGVPVVQRHAYTAQEAFDSLDAMRDREGYVLQFTNGDMVKAKCPWYRRLHRSVTFLRERDIAAQTLAGNLDDIKGALRETGIDLAPVEEVESRVMAELCALQLEVETLAATGKGQSRKEMATQFCKHPLFYLVMQVWEGKAPHYEDWFTKNRLKEHYGLRVLSDNAALMDSVG